MSETVNGRWYSSNSSEDRTMTVKETAHDFECDWASIHSDPITYGFKGWTTDPNSEDASFDIESVDAENTTYYAVYKEKDYKMIFNVGGGGNTVIMTFTSLPDGMTHESFHVNVGNLAYEYVTIDDRQCLQLTLTNITLNTILMADVSDRNFQKITGHSYIELYKNNNFNIEDSNRKLSEFNIRSIEGTVLYSYNGNYIQEVSVDAEDYKHIFPFVTKRNNEYYPSITFTSDSEWIRANTEKNIEDDDNCTTEIGFESDSMPAELTEQQLIDGRRTLIHIKQMEQDEGVEFTILQKITNYKSPFRFRIINNSSRYITVDALNLPLSSLILHFQNGRSLTVNINENTIKDKSPEVYIEGDKYVIPSEKFIEVQVDYSDYYAGKSFRSIERNSTGTIISGPASINLTGVGINQNGFSVYNGNIEPWSNSGYVNIISFVN